MLGFLDPSKAAVGSYSVGVKGIDIVIALTTSLYAVFMPRASYYFEKEDKRFYRNLLRYSFNITFFIAMPAIATMSTMSSPIVYLVSGADGTRYQNSGLVLIILSAMMLTFSLADNIYTQILIPQKKEKTYLFTMLLGVALNVGLSLLLGGVLFQEKPVVGVAIATMISDVLLLGILLYLTREYSLETVFNWNNLKIVGVSLLIGVGSYFLCPALISAFQFPGGRAWVAQLLALITCVGLDALIYIALLLLLKENLVSSFLPKARKKREKENG